jgi:nicotinamidase-related amidase
VPRMKMIPLGSAPTTGWLVSETTVDMTRPSPPMRAVQIEAEPQEIIINLGRTAMIVIDMQNDFCSPKGWLAHIGVDVTPARQPIAPLNGLLPSLRQLRVPVIWVNWGNRPDKLNLSPSLLHVYKPTGEGVGLGDPLPESQAPVLQKGSWAASIVEGLQVDLKDIHVAKYRMSGFWDTELDSILRNLGVTTLLFGGVNADQCVLCTLQDANFLGYDCVLVSDCTATTSPAYCWDATLYNVKQCFGFVATSAAIRKSFNGG